MLTLLLGNDLAGGKILVDPKVAAVPTSTDKLEENYSKVFSVCATAISKSNSLNLVFIW